MSSDVATRVIQKSNIVARLGWSRQPYGSAFTSERPQKSEPFCGHFRLVSVRASKTTRLTYEEADVEPLEETPDYGAKGHGTYKIKKKGFRLPKAFAKVAVDLFRLSKMDEFDKGATKFSIYHSAFQLRVQ